MIVFTFQIKRRTKKVHAKPEPKMLLFKIFFATTKTSLLNLFGIDIYLLITLMIKIIKYAKLKTKKSVVK